MKSLPTLIKLAQRNIDAIAVEIAKAQARIEELVMSKATAAAKTEAEQAMAQDDLALNMLGSLPAYLHRQKSYQEQLDNQIAEIETSIEQIRLRLIAAYREKSKLENLQAQYALKEKQELASLEQAQLDEAALTRRA